MISGMYFAIAIAVALFTGRKWGIAVERHRKHVDAMQKLDSKWNPPMPSGWKEGDPVPPAPPSPRMYSDNMPPHRMPRS